MPLSGDAVVVGLKDLVDQFVAASRMRLHPTHDKLRFVGQLEFEIKPIIKYKLLASGLPNLEAQL